MTLLLYQCPVAPRVGLEEGDAKGLNVGVYFLTARASTSTCRLNPLGLPARGPGPAPLTGIALGAHVHAGNTDPCRASMVWSSRPNHRGGPKCLILLPSKCLHLHSWEPRGFSMTSPWGRAAGECASSGKPTRIQQLRRTLALARLWEQVDRKFGASLNPYPSAAMYHELIDTPKGRPFSHRSP